jgi:hypothetical protein
MIKNELKSVGRLFTSIMSLNPINRDTMRQLKVLKDEEQRLSKVNKLVYELYSAAVETAMYSTNTSYTYELLHDKYFILANIQEILEYIQELFPDCSVKHTLMARGRDRKMYDISTIDDSKLPLVNHVEPNSYIVIDWS